MNKFCDYSLWDKLTHETRPIFMYGTGNGGDKIISALESRGAGLTGVFASDGFVRDRYFHGFKVRAYSDVVSEYGNDIVILLAFGTTLDSVKDFIYSLDKRHELLIPDVPLYGGPLFDIAYFSANKDILTDTARLFADDVSQKLFYDIVNFRLTGKTEYLTDTGDTAATLKSLFYDSSVKKVMDGGAFKGDSAAEYSMALHPEKIIAIEADPKTYKKLSAFAEAYKDTEIIPINAALSDKCGLSDFVSSGSRGSGTEGKNKRADETTVESATIDSLLNGESVDMIKLDVEGAEKKAILGAVNTITRFSPSLSVSLYHRTDDIFELVQLVHDLLPKHRLYLRRPPCIPMWDITLYAKKA